MNNTSAKCGFQKELINVKDNKTHAIDCIAQTVGNSHVFRVIPE